MSFAINYYCTVGRKEGRNERQYNETCCTGGHADSTRHDIQLYRSNYAIFHRDLRGKAGTGKSCGAVRIILSAAPGCISGKCDENLSVHTAVWKYNGTCLQSGGGNTKLSCHVRTAEERYHVHGGSQYGRWNLP